MKFWKKPKIKDLLPFPVDASHKEYSMILSVHDEPSKPTSCMLELSFKAIKEAHKIDLSDVSKRLKTPPHYPDIWPGEHYKLLAAFVKILKPKLVIEIGTATGLSALCLKQYLPKTGQVHTFDLFKWQQDPLTVLKTSDFEDQKLVQHTEDLTNAIYFAKHKKLLESADLIFIDATHDGKVESNLMKKFKTLEFKTNPYLIFDDIRVWTMLKMWRSIKHPKLDLTSFGHWSGTGLVKWQP